MILYILMNDQLVPFKKKKNQYAWCFNVMPTFSKMHIGLGNSSWKHYREKRENKNDVTLPNDLCTCKKTIGGYIFIIFKIVCYTFIFLGVSHLCVLQWTLYIYRNSELGLGVGELGLGVREATLLLTVCDGFNLWLYCFTTKNFCLKLFK